MPDVRGMYPEAAGFDSLGVGGVHGDAIRNIQGNHQACGHVQRSCVRRDNCRRHVGVFTSDLPVAGRCARASPVYTARGVFNFITWRPHGQRQRTARMGCVGLRLPRHSCDRVIMQLVSQDTRKLARPNGVAQKLGRLGLSFQNQVINWSRPSYAAPIW